MRLALTFPGWKRLLLGAVAMVAVVFLAVGPLHLASGPYGGRNGGIEALEDFAEHRPLKLYVYRAAQIDLVARVPGLACPGMASNPLLNVRHVFIDEAMTSEGYTPTWIEMRRGEAARSFAYLYNVTTLDLHREEVLRACPKVFATRYQPLIWYRDPPSRR